MKIRIKSVLNYCFITILTVFSAYIIINWVLFLSVGYAVRFILPLISDYVKYGLAIIFLAIAVHFDSKEKKDQNDDQNNNETNTFQDEYNDQ